MTQVQRARADHWEAVKETRLRALRDAPYAFASTYAREDAFTDGEWQRRTAQGTWFLACSAGVPVGISAMVSEDHARGRSGCGDRSLGPVAWPRYQLTRHALRRERIGVHDPTPTLRATV